MATYKIYTDPRAKKKHVPVKAEIYHAGLYAYVSTPFKIPKEYWDGEKIRRAHPDHLQLNLKVQEFEAALRRNELSLEPGYTASDIKTAYLRAEGIAQNGSFTDWLTTIEGKFREDKKFASADHHCDTRNTILRYHPDGVRFSAITVKWLTNLRKSLEREDYATDTIYGVFKDIKSAYRKAIGESMAREDKNPFLHWPMPQQKSEDPKPKSFPKSYITIFREEMANHQIGTNTWLSLASICISYYFLGMRIKDVLELEWDKNVDLPTAKLYYSTSKSRKTKSSHFTIHTAALEILRELETIRRNKYVMPFLDEGLDDEARYYAVRAINTLIDEHLSRFCASKGMGKRMSPHRARHTVNAVLRPQMNQAGRKDIFQHADIKTTEGYDHAHELENTFNQAVSML